jgi:hypothetical protein
MADVTVTRSLDRDPSAVWALLANFGDTDWIPMADHVTLEGEGVGMRRLLHMEGAEPIIEQLDAIDHDARVLHYSIENNPLPTSEYRAVCTVTEDGDGTSIEWVVTFVPIGDEGEVAGMISGVYDMMAGWIADATASD